MTKRYQKRLKIMSEEREKAVCSHCGQEIEDLDVLATDKYWDNRGNHILYHICPYCGKSVEEIIL